MVIRHVHVYKERHILITPLLPLKIIHSILQNKPVNQAQ